MVSTGGRSSGLWQMATDPKYAPGQIVDGKLICGAKKKNLEPCGAPPLKGGKRCRNHGGASQQAKAAADRRLAEMEAQRELDKAVVTLGLPQDIDPGKALLDEIARTYGAVKWLEAKVRELEPDQLVWGVTQTEVGVGPEGLIDKTTEKAEFNAWYRLYCEERDRLSRVAALALKAGIEERRIKLAESQGDLVAQAIRSILDALNLTPQQLELVPVIVPQTLRSLGEITAQ